MRFVAPLLLSLVAGSARAQQAPTYVIYFQEWSAAIGNTAHQVIDNAASWAKAHPSLLGA